MSVADSAFVPTHLTMSKRKAGCIEWDEIFPEIPDSFDGAPLSQPVFVEQEYYGLKTKFAKIGESTLHPERQVEEDCDCDKFLDPNKLDGYGRWCVNQADWDIMEVVCNSLPNLTGGHARLFVWPHGMNGKTMHPDCVQAYFKTILESTTPYCSYELPCGGGDDCAVAAMCALRRNYYKTMSHWDPCMCLDKLVASIALHGPQAYPEACQVFDCCLRHTKESVAWQPQLFTIITFLCMLHVVQSAVVFK